MLLFEKGSVYFHLEGKFAQSSGKASTHEVLKVIMYENMALFRNFRLGIENSEVPLPHLLEEMETGETMRVEDR
jgi:hypothetical protein